MQEKQLLRTWLKSKRVKMPASDVAAKSEIICGKLIGGFNWDSIKTVHCYSAITSLNEVDTAAFIEFLNKKDIELTMQSQLPKEVADTKKYDVVIVPTLGFDSSGFRLGWGGGFYDRFLAAQEKSIKVGLCFESGHIKKLIPVEPHDIKLDFVITEERLYRFD